MPRQNQKIIRLQGLGLGLGNNRDRCARRKPSKFILVDLGDIRNIFLGKTAQLQNDIALGRGPVSKDLLSLGINAIDKLDDLIALIDYTVFKSFVGFKR